MKKHILPIISLIMLILVFGNILFDYFTKGSVPSEAWGILVVMIITNSYSWDYWKEISSKVWNEDGSVKD